MPKCYASFIQRSRKRTSSHNLYGKKSNVLKTRSGLLIVRPLKAADTDLTPSDVTEHQYKTNKVVRYKSMNHMSFVTRFQLIRNGTALEVSGSKHDSDTLLDEMPFAYDKSRWNTPSKRYIPSESHTITYQIIQTTPGSKRPHTDLVPSAQTASIHPDTGLVELTDPEKPNIRSVETNIGAGKANTADEGDIGKLHSSKHSKPGQVDDLLQMNNLVKHAAFKRVPGTLDTKRTMGSGTLDTDFRTSLEAQEAASAAETLVALANNTRCGQQEASQVPDAAELFPEIVGLTQLSSITPDDSHSMVTENVLLPTLRTQVDQVHCSSSSRNVAGIKLEMPPICIKALTSQNNPGPAENSHIVADSAQSMPGPRFSLVDSTLTFIDTLETAAEVDVTSDNHNDLDSDSDLEQFQSESHMYTLDANGNKIHKCVICSKVFTILAAFRAHVSAHYRQKNRCAVCAKQFSRSWLLKGHMRTHTGEKPYRCQHPGCDKAFADKSNLRSHSLIHTTKGKTFVCVKCQRAFAQKRYLHKHQLEVCK